MRRLGFVCLFLSCIASLQASEDKVNCVKLAEKLADQLRHAEQILKYVEDHQDNYDGQTYESLTNNLEKIRVVATAGVIASTCFAAKDVAEKNASSYKAAYEAQNWTETKKGYTKGFFNNSKKSKK